MLRTIIRKLPKIRSVENRQIDRIRRQIPANTRTYLAIRDGWYCAYCQTVFDEGDKELTIDHIHPISKRSTYQYPNINRLNNLVLACRNCNASKGNKLLGTEWYPWARARVNKLLQQSAAVETQ